MNAIRGTRQGSNSSSRKSGFEAFTALVEQERKAVPFKSYAIDSHSANTALPDLEISQAVFDFIESEKYQTWLKTNVISQKQAGFTGVYIRVPLGNISSDTSRSLIEKLEGFVGDDIRITIQQGLFLRFVPESNLPFVYDILEAHGLALPGANSINDITACPGTDTCNLAISDSTHISMALEKVMAEEFPELVYNNDIKIKISGCMNACGQHSMAQIGFHGSSLKANGKVLPALQVLLGGGTLGNGEGRISDKVIKVPSKRGTDALRWLLNDYETHSSEGEYFNDYYDRQGDRYFYTLLKPLASLENLQNTDFVDWGQQELFETEIGVGECASVMVDLVAVLLFEAEEKAEWAEAAFAENRYSDAIYHAYSVFISAAKALLLDKDVHSSTHHGIISEFDKNFAEEHLTSIDFKTAVMEINQHEPSPEFAAAYLGSSLSFLEKARSYREKLVNA